MTIEEKVKADISQFILVYYELGNGGYAETVCLYRSEDEYNKKIEFHEKDCKQKGFNIVTETIIEPLCSELDTLIYDFERIESYLTDAEREEFKKLIASQQNK